MLTAKETAQQRGIGVIVHHPGSLLKNVSPSPMKTRLLSLIPLTLFIAALSVYAAPLNIILITADDLNWDSLGCNGCKIPNITPRIDQLASEGVLFREAHATVPVCQPVRATMSTGLYPMRSGCTGFMPIREDVTTLNEVLHKAGYLISMLGKNSHYEPHKKWRVDYDIQASDLMEGRSPDRIREHTRKFLQLAAQRNQPFFHHVNCQDPHRPFLWKDSSSTKNNSSFPAVSRVIRPEEVEVPAFLENLPAVRQEVADYFTCVHRLDECVGAILDEVKAAGRENDTLVLFFGGDHGMAFPFGKANVYANSSKGALIVRWPNMVPAGRIDERHLIATIDIAPTLLEAAKLPALEGIDGRSFLPLALGDEQENRDSVFTMFHSTSAKRSFEMRCIRTRHAAYIWNAWSDGKTDYRAENMSGLTWKAMLSAAETDPAMRERCDFYLKRRPEEFYRLNDDPAERNNLITDPHYAEEVTTMRKQLAAFMRSTNDPLSSQFEALANSK